MELVRQPPLLFIASKCFKECILIFEYSYFLEQNNKAENAIKLAVKKYQQSGTQVAVLKALKNAIKEHSNDHQALQDSIFDIILANRMCKLFCLSTVAISHALHKQMHFCDQLLHAIQFYIDSQSLLHLKENFCTTMCIDITISLCSVAFKLMC